MRLTPYAWAKLLFLRDRGPTEVGGFGISCQADLLLVEDICLVRQQCTPVSVTFDDHAVADYFDVQVDRGRTPAEFARIWVHTHPGSSPEPSATDEATFERCFGAADWALMLILARGGRTYARLRLGTDPVANLQVPVELDFREPFSATDHEAWATEFEQQVHFELGSPSAGRETLQSYRDPRWSDWDEPWWAEPMRCVPVGLAQEVAHG